VEARGSLTGKAFERGATQASVLWLVGLEAHLLNLEWAQPIITKVMARDYVIHIVITWTPPQKASLDSNFKRQVPVPACT
jgi:hypothetical protein